MKEIVNAGYKLAEERYLAEPALGVGPEARLGSYSVMHYYRGIIPDCQKHVIMVPGYMSLPAESLDVNPGADFKVFLDMQFNLLANRANFWGLYGVECYHSAYADEEILRWSVKLFRHYCIEGRRERLS